MKKLLSIYVEERSVIEVELNYNNSSLRGIVKKYDNIGIWLAQGISNTDQILIPYTSILYTRYLRESK